MAKGMRHLNGNLLCAVDVETTGLDHKKHDIFQIAILPLDSEIKPSTNILPFYMDMQVVRPENIDKKAVKMQRVDFARRQQRAIDPYTCADMFDLWFDNLNLPIYKKICPLAQNWPFDRSFILEWLGLSSFEHSFSPIYRDTMVSAAFNSDICDFHSDSILFTQYNLQFLCSRLNIKNEKPHDALQDCIATAEVYRRMLLRS